MVISQEVTRLNDEGVSRLMLGDFENAIAAFQSSMQLLKSASSSSTEAEARLQSAPNRLVWAAGRSSSKAANLDDDTFYLYRNGIHFFPAGISSHSNDDNTLSSKADRQLCAAIVSFNMALAYHMYATDGTRSNVDRITAYRKAFQFYQVTQELVDALALQHEPAQQLIVVALNNQAQIYHKLGSDTEALNKLELQQSISIFSFCVDDDDTTAIVSEQDITKFLINATRISRPQAAACA